MTPNHENNPGPRPKPAKKPLTVRRFRRKVWRGFLIFVVTLLVALLIVTRTGAGEAALTAAAEAGALTIETGDEAVATAEAITPLQPGQRIRKGLVASRLAALRLMGRPAPRYRGFHLREAARAMGPRDNLRNFLGMIRRIATGRV